MGIPPFKLGNSKEIWVKFLELLLHTIQNLQVFLPLYPNLEMNIFSTKGYFCCLGLVCIVAFW